MPDSSPQLKPTDPVIEDLARWLLNRRFTLSRETYLPESFGDWLREYHSADIWIMLARDRGRWSVEATLPGDGSWYSLAAWASYVRGLPVEEPNSPSELAAILRDTLSQMRAAARRAPSLAVELQRAENERVSRLLGGSLPPDVGRNAELAPTHVTEYARRQATVRVARNKRDRRAR